MVLPHNITKSNFKPLSPAQESIGAQCAIVTSLFLQYLTFPSFVHMLL